MNLTVKFSGTLTINAGDEGMALAEAAQQCPPGAHLEVIGREPDLGPLEPLPVERLTAAQHNRFPGGRWASGK